MPEPAPNSQRSGGDAEGERSAALAKPSQAFLGVRLHQIEGYLQDFLAGDEDAGASLRDAMVNLPSLAEASWAYSRIDTVLASRSSPISIAETRAVFFLAEMSAGDFPDFSVSFFHRCQYFAQDRDDIPLQREAMLRRAALLCEKGDRDAREAARSVLKDALWLGTTQEPNDYLQFIRTYTLLGRCHVAEHSGSFRKDIIGIASAIETYLENNSVRVQRLLSNPSREQGADFRAVLEASLLVAESSAFAQDMQRSREHYLTLLDLVQSDAPLASWGRVKILQSFARSIYKDCRASRGDGPIESGQFEYALKLVDDAQTIIARQKAGFSDSVLHSKLLFQKGLMLYDLHLPEAAHKSFNGALFLIEPEVAQNDTHLRFARKICKRLERCKIVLQQPEAAAPISLVSAA